jgi:phage terminase large subunit-like protein
MAFSAQYQQAPEPAGGKIIKRKMLQYYSEIERQRTDRIVMSWDVALSEQETGDYSVGVVLLNRGDRCCQIRTLVPISRHADHHLRRIVN